MIAQIMEFAQIHLLVTATMVGLDLLVNLLFVYSIAVEMGSAQSLVLVLVVSAGLVWAIKLTAIISHISWKAFTICGT